MAATGFTPIKIYASSTASSVPLAANLDNTNGAELAINTADGRLFYKDSSGVVQTMASKATGAIGGSTTQIQFNNAGALGGSASLTWSGTVLTSSGFSGPLNGTVGATTANTGSFTTLTTSSTITDNGGTANGVTYLNGSKVVTSGSALTFDGTDLTYQSAIKFINNDGSANKAILSTYIYGGSGATGTLNLSSTYGNSNQTRIKIGVGGAAATSFDIDSVEGMRLTSTGLGIGTSSPATKLDVQGASSSSTNWIWAGGNAANPPAGCTYGVLLGRNLSGGFSEANIVWGQGISSNQFLGFGKWTGSAYTEQMRIDPSGNLGLGVTPSAWVRPVIQVGAVGSVSNFVGTNTGLFGANFYFDSSSSNRYISNGFSGFYGIGLSNGQHQWYTAPSGTAGNAITFTQAMTLDASGQLQLGTTAPIGSANATDTVLTLRGKAAPRNGYIELGNFGTTGNDQSLGYLYFYDGTTLNSALEVARATSTSTAYMRFSTNNGSGNTERMRIDSSGNLGIGTSSPTTKLTVEGTVTVTGAGIQLDNGQAISMKNSGGTSRQALVVDGSNNLGVGGTVDGGILFYTSAGNERMRITSGGNVLIGSTTNTTNSNLILTGATRWAVGTQGGGNLFYIVRDSDGVGQYMVQGSTSWTATSDERLKDIIEPITDAASKVSTLRAVIGKFKKDAEGTRRSFLIAQDVQAVLPEAVTVQEDELGTLGVQYTEVIPLLVAAIKELKAEVDSLKSQLKGA